MVFAGSPVDPLANKSSGSLPIVRDVYHKPKLTLNWYVPLASATDAPGLSGDNQREAKDKQEDENHGCLARREWKLPLMVKEGQSGNRDLVWGSHSEISLSRRNCNEKDQTERKSMHGRCTSWKFSGSLG
jgi:hypothetical protein